MKETLLVLNIFAAFFSVKAQNENNIWIFSDYVGLDFNSGTPVPVSSGMDGFEGVSAISDNQGNLLFYTNGETAYNANHQIMLNGDSLAGSISTTQGALFAKKPGQEEMYYLFTIGHEGGGIYYSEIDLSLDSGLGGITQNKNVLLTNSVCEQVAGVYHVNNNDIWIVVHKYGSSEFYSYLITSTGIGSSPVISNVGIVVGSGVNINTQGEMDVAIDGSRLAIVHRGLNVIQILDFDAASGSLSNPILLNANNPYSVEFSPNGNVLYATSLDDSLGMKRIFQYNLQAGSQAQIESTKNIFYPFGYIGLELAPDGRIYFNGGFVHTLSRINFPDVFGAGCGIEEHVISFNNINSNYTGLANYVVQPLPTGLGMNQSEIHVDIYPNPVDDILYFKSNELIEEIKIYDLTGKQLYTKIPNSNDFSVDLSDLSPGKYLVYVNQGDQSIVERIIID